MSLNESIVEDAALEWFGEQSRSAPTLIPAFSQREKEEVGEVVQTRCARTITPALSQGEREKREVIRRLNPAIPPSRAHATLRDPAIAGLPKLVSGELSVAEVKTSR